MGQSIRPVKLDLRLVFAKAKWSALFQSLACLAVAEWKEDYSKIVKSDLSSFLRNGRENDEEIVEQT